MKLPVAIGIVVAIAIGIFVAISISNQDKTATSSFKCIPTDDNIEGPYYKAGAPTWQVPNDLPGERLVVTGKVLDQNCEPVKEAVLDFWQADSTGTYDNSGYMLRGTIAADDDGNYRLDTISPGKYETRPRHLHVKVWASGNGLLTTQLYIIENDRDAFVKDSLIIEPKAQGEIKTATFDFVVLK